MFTDNALDPPPYFSWYKFILVSSVQRIFCHKGAASFLANSNLAFVFLSVNSGLHLVVLEGFFWDIIFLTTEKNSVTIQFICLLWSFRPFGVAGLVSADLLFKNETECWFGHSYSFCFSLSRRFTILKINSKTQCKLSYLSSSQGYLWVLHLAKLREFIQNSHELICQSGIPSTQLILYKVKDKPSSLSVHVTLCRMNGYQVCFSEKRWEPYNEYCDQDVLLGYLSMREDVVEDRTHVRFVLLSQVDDTLIIVSC